MFRNSSMQKHGALGSQSLPLHRNWSAAPDAGRKKITGGRFRRSICLRRLGSLRVLKLSTLLLFGFIIWALRQPRFDRFVHRISNEGSRLKTPHQALSLAQAQDNNNFYSSDAARSFCKHHGWPVFSTSTPDRARKIYDLFMVNTELDWLEVRLNSTYQYVDYFIIVESAYTFTNNPKPLTIRDNWAKFAPYHDKLIYHQLEFPEKFNPTRTWDYEDLQRNAMFTQVFPKLQGNQQPKLGDAIIVADVDEILRPETLLILRTCQYPRRLTLRSRFYYYSFQFLHQGPEWAHPQATYYQGSRTILPVNLRNGDGGLPILNELEKGDLWNAGWHCSSCLATIQEFLTKISSFSHTWMNQEYYRDRNRIADAIREGRDLWGRATETFVRIDGNTDVPKFLLENQERFRYMLNRDGPTAGFQDYPEAAMF
jgi:beta-1,4-mannosyl-glycoprotein beta-1,4-N-acetylglucosaminyltransferase